MWNRPGAQLNLSSAPVQISYIVFIILLMFYGHIKLCKLIIVKIVSFSYN